jgi:hypothetical protein
MTRQVQIVIPDICKDDFRYGEAIDFDQRIGRLTRNDSTIVNIDGVEIQFPATWLKPVVKT